MNKANLDYRLYLVTDRSVLRGRDLLKSIEQAIQGGVTLVQLREKSASTREFLQLALKVKEVTSHYKVPLIINDRLDIALASDAEGLHVGQDDLPIKTARKFMGPGKIIGVSAGTLQEALLAQEQGADYLGVGAMFATPTKTDARLVSLEDLRQIKQAAAIPVVAIGGINKTNAQEVMTAGIDGVSVVSAILGREDCYTAARQLRKLI